MKRGFKKWAEEEALKFRSKLSLEYYERLKASELAEYMNVGLISPYDISGLTDKEKNNLLNHDSTSWSAITIKNYKDDFLIIYNPKHSNRRQESNLMHELSHVICGHNMEVIENRKTFPFPLRGYDEEQENEANWLGGCLQMPRKALEWGKYRGMSNSELAEHFGASSKMVEYRLNITGVNRQINRTFR